MMEMDLRELIRRYSVASFTVERRVSAMLRVKTTDALTPDQYAMLRYIREHGPCHSSELADAFCVGKSSVTAIISRLADKGLIERRTDDKDRRVIHLSVTEQGERVFQEVEEQVEQILSEYLSHFSPEEGYAFIATFEKLAALLSAPAKPKNEEG